MPLLNWLTPVRIAVLAGRHAAPGVWALVNNIPLSARAVDVWGPGLRMPAQGTDPRVHVVDCNKEDVELLLGARRYRSDKRKKEQEGFLVHRHVKWISDNQQPAPVQ